MSQERLLQSNEVSTFATFENILRPSFEKDNNIFYADKGDIERPRIHSVFGDKVEFNLYKTNSETDPRKVIKISIIVGFILVIGSMVGSYYFIMAPLFAISVL